MIEITDNLSSRIANLGFMCACLVVCIHTPEFGRCGNVADEILRCVFPARITVVAVPFFFVVSGFFLYGKIRDGGVCRELRKRLKTLLIPYCALNILWFVVYTCIRLYAVDCCGYLGRIDFSWRIPFDVLGLFFVQGPSLGVLWYVRALMLYCILSPVLVNVIRRPRKCAILLPILLYVGYWVWFVYPWCWWKRFFELGISLYGLFYFSLGMFLREYGWLAVSRMKSMILLLVGFLMAFLGLDPFSIPFLLWGAYGVMSKKSLPSVLTRNTFAIYVFHPMLFYLLSVGLKYFGKYDFRMTGCGYAVYFVVGLGGGIVLGEMVRKNKYARFFLLGGR